MTLKVYVRDRDGTLVNEPELERVTGLRFGSIWPKGYAGCSFRINRHIAHSWLIRNAYDIQIKDGHKTVFEGFLSNLNRALNGLQSYVQLEALGKYSLLASRTMRKRWIDSAPFDSIFWPASQVLDESQNRLPTKVVNNVLTMTLPDGYNGTSGEDVIWRYSTISGDFIDRVTYKIVAESDDGIRVRLQNVDNASATERTSSTGTGSQYTAEEDVTLTQGNTNSVDWNIDLTATDVDYNMYLQIYEAFVFVDYVPFHTAFGNPNYFADEIIQDVLLTVAPDEISRDFGDWVSPELQLLPFVTKGDAHEPADSIIQRALSYGDVSFNSYGFSIWDSDGTSDNLPLAELIQRPGLTDWEYELSLQDLSSFNDEESLDQLYNYIHVQYTNASGFVDYVSADDDEDLFDLDSIATYGRRDKVLDVGKGLFAVAKNYGQRFLEIHKDPLRKSRLSTRNGLIRRKDGTMEPASWVRAGKRIKLVDYNGGTVYLLRRVDYNAESGELMMEPDLPTDSLSIITAQQTLGYESVTPRPPRV